tara:strand:+ start:1453 stop:5448 length:3996 start_codon:yes stop_codon:yes gene_type:complete
MIFPKISGNSNSLFDLIDITETYNGLTINNSNQDGVFTAEFTDGADGHTEVYLFFVIKNTMLETDSATNLTLGQIKIISVSEEGTEIRTEWSTDGATVIHEQTGPIECDYVLTGTNDLFVGIEDGAGNIGTGDVATHVNTDPSSSFDTITSSDKFVKFKVENGENGVGEVKIDTAGSSTHVHQMPLYTATQLCSAENGGIPNNSYAAFPVRISIDDVSAFDTKFFRMIISHDGTVGSGVDADSSDIVIPITISAVNLMQCQVFVGGTLKVTGNATGDGGALISRMNAISPTPTAGNISAVNYGFAEGAAAPSSTTNFSHFDNATLYSTKDSDLTTFTHLQRNAFANDESAVSWKETSAIGILKNLTITHVENESTNVINNLLNGTNDIDNEKLESTDNQFNISFSQTPEGCNISTIEENHDGVLGGYINFTQAEATKTATYTFTTTSSRETINTILDIGFIKYPVMSMSANTRAKLTDSSYTTGKIYGVNSTFTGIDSVDSSPIHHDHADSGNSEIHIPAATAPNVSHVVPGHLGNYFQNLDSGTFAEDVNTIPAYTSLEIRLNSFQTSDNPLFNGITSFGDIDIMKGKGFAKDGCDVEQATVGNIADLPAIGEGNPANADGENNQISVAISDTGHRDYAVRIRTTSEVFRNTQTIVEDSISLHYDYNKQITGYGAERYKAKISTPTGLIDYGFGLTPNHIQFTELSNIAFAQYPSLPDLNINVFEDKPIDLTNISGESNAVTIDTKWTKLTVLPNDLTGAVSSSRTGASDGLYDWAKDTSADNTNKGTFQIKSTYDATVTDGSNLVDLEIHEQLVVNGAVSLNATTITVGTAGVLAEGMRLIEQKGGSNASQNTSNTALFAATPYIVSDITGTTVTIVKDLGYNSDGTSNVVTTNVLPAIDDGADLVFIDDWTQTGMLVRHDNLVETEKEYSIAEITYVGGTDEGNQFSLATFPAALQAGATKVRLRLTHKRLTGGAVTNGVATGSSTNKKLIFLKPHENFTEVDAGVNLKYEIKNQPLNRAKIGEKVRVKTGTTQFPAVTQIDSSATQNQETIVTGDTSGIQSNLATCDIIVEKRGTKNVFEPGVTRPDGTKLLSKKNVGNKNTSTQSTYYAGLNPAQGLALYQFPATEVGGGFYFKEFSVALTNNGEEDLYWASAEFVDPTWVRFQDSSGLVYAKQPSGATNVNWQVCNLGGDFTNKVTSSIFSTNANIVQRPSELIASLDGRCAKNINDSNLENVFGCRFEVSVGAGITGSYYKYLKVEYVRDTGRTKYYKNSLNEIVERPFADKEVYQALIPILITLDAAGQIEMQDVDGTSIETGTTISISGLIA